MSEWNWQGRRLRVEVLHSYAGIAQQILIASDDGSRVLVDCGDGTLRDLLHRDVELGAIDALLITHGHFDHVGGLHSLLGFMRMIGREKPLKIIAPAGCHQLGQIVRGFLNCYGESLPFEIERVAATPDEVIEFGAFAVLSYPVVHCGSAINGKIFDQIPAVGYRVTSGKETVAITGDSGMCDALKELVRDADLALIEATFTNEMDVSPEVLETVHLNERLASELGKLAKQFQLIHRIRKDLSVP
jgi:ribonuclease Z